MTTGANLEQSFDPVYARGLLRRGQSAFAVFGVNDQETQSSIDASLTFAILWLDLCRRTHAGRLHVEGLKLFVPAGTSDLVRARVAHLNHFVAKWHLYAVNEREDSVAELDCRDRGSGQSRRLPMALARPREKPIRTLRKPPVAAGLTPGRAGEGACPYMCIAADGTRNHVGPGASPCPASAAR